MDKNIIDLNSGKEIMNIYGGSERKKRFLIDGKNFLNISVVTFLNQ